ncbi:MAG: hypothetical protein QXV69_00495 [Sulfolobaceae archaeon]
MRIEIKEISEFKKEYLSLIKYSNECVTQIINKLPSDAVVRQACYLFFKIISNNKNTKINNPTLLFLLLISGESQLNEAIKKLGAKEGSPAYIINCCKEGEEKFEIINKLSREERLILTKNAVTFI